MDKGYTRAQVAEETALLKEIGGDVLKYRMSLLEFLKLIELADFRFRYTAGDSKTAGIEARHEILQEHIKKLEVQEHERNLSP